MQYLNKKIGGVMQVFDYFPSQAKQSISSKSLKNSCLLLALGGTLAALIPLTQELLHAKKIQSSSRIHAYNAKPKAKKTISASHLSFDPFYFGHPRVMPPHVIPSHHVTSSSATTPTHKSAHTANPPNKAPLMIGVKSRAYQSSSMSSPPLSKEITIRSTKKTGPLISPTSTIGINNTKLYNAENDAQTTAASIIPVINQVHSTQSTINRDLTHASADNQQAAIIEHKIPDDQRNVVHAQDQIHVASATLATYAQNLQVAHEALTALQQSQTSRDQMAQNAENSVTNDITSINAKENTIISQTEGIFGKTKIGQAQAEIEDLQNIKNTDDSQENSANKALLAAQKRYQDAVTTYNSLLLAVNNDKAAQVAASKALAPFLKIPHLPHHHHSPFYHYHYVMVWHLGASYALQAKLAQQKLEEINVKLAADEKSLQQEGMVIKSDKSAQSTLQKKDSSAQEVATSANNTLNKTINQSGLYQAANAISSLQGAEGQLSGWNYGVKHWLTPVLNAGGTFQKPIPGQSQPTDFWSGYTGWSAVDMANATLALENIDEKQPRKNRAILSSIEQEAESLLPQDNGKTISNATDLNNILSNDVKATDDPNKTQDFGTGAYAQLLFDEATTDKDVQEASFNYQNIKAPLLAASQRLETATQLVDQQTEVVKSDEEALARARITLNRDQWDTVRLNQNAQGYTQNASQEELALRTSQAVLAHLQEQEALATQQVRTLTQQQNALMSTLATANAKANGLRATAASLRDSWVDSGDTNTLAEYNATVGELNELNQTIFNLSGEQNENLSTIVDPNTPQTINESTWQATQAQLHDEDLSERLASEYLLNEPLITSPES